MVAAALTAISARGTPPDFKTVVRQLPVWPDGIHAFDLLVEMERHELDGLVFTAPPEAAARLIEAGFSPLVMVNDPAGRHAVAMTGIQRGRFGGSRCTAGLLRIQFVDVRSGRTQWVSADRFQRMQSEEQMMVFFKRAALPELSKRGFPLKIAQRVDARFRADTLLRRAFKHKVPNQQMMILLKNALSHDPCYEKLRRISETAAKSLGRGSLILPPCQPDSL